MKSEAKIFEDQVNFYHRAKREVILHLAAIGLCLLASAYFYWFNHPRQLSLADVGYLIDAPSIRSPMYHPAEPIAFLTKSLSTQIHYNFLNEATRLGHFGYAFSSDAQESIRAFLSSLNLHPLNQQLQVSFEPQFAPILLDYQSPEGRIFQWAYDLDFVLILSPLDNNGLTKAIGPFHLRSIISRTDHPINGYLLQITSTVFEPVS